MKHDDPRTACSLIFENGIATANELSDAFIKPPFGYFGAKQRLATRIIEMLPPHHAWVEVFCGSAVVTLNKPRAAIEVINDLDGNVVNLFEVLRDRPNDLCAQVAATPYARDEFVLSRSGELVSDSLERARRFLVATMMTVNGTSGSVHSGFSFSDSYARGGREARVNRWYQLPERLERIIERLRSVRIENKDAHRVVEQFANRPATLMYLDPPYLMDRRHTYATDANEEVFHEELLKACVGSNAMMIVSGYKNSLYSKYLNATNGWTARSVATKTRGTKGPDIVRTEMLWVNSAFKVAKKTGKVPVTLTEIEAKEKKFNPERPGPKKAATAGATKGAR